METCENICWQYKNDLKHLYSLKEIDEFIRMAFLKLSDWNRIDVSLNKKTIRGNPRFDQHSPMTRQPP